jgi:hypothetical protein
MALGLAALVLAIGIAAANSDSDWVSPGVLILPILAGGLLLWPRALLILFGQGQGRPAGTARRSDASRAARPHPGAEHDS